MHDCMPYDPIQGESQGHRASEVPKIALFHVYLLRHLQWQLANDHLFLNYTTISKFDQAQLFLFFLVLWPWTWRGPCGQSVHEKVFPISVTFDMYTVSKNVPPLACYNFDAYQWILIFFGRNVTNKVGNQRTLYYATSSNLYFCTTWQNGETRKSHFSLDRIVRCLPERKKIVICDVFDSV